MEYAMDNAVQEIYDLLGDDESKEIYYLRYLYNKTNEKRYLEKMIEYVWGGKEILDTLKTVVDSERNMYIFGAGVWCENLLNAFSDYKWTGIIDSNPKKDFLKGIKVVSYKDFIDKYTDEVVVISSRVYCYEMYEQLINDGVDADNIVNIGEKLDVLSKLQYFDLEYMKLSNKEVMIDCGSYDGMTAITFAQKVPGDVFVYAFEPDLENVKKCMSNLKENNIKHTVIKKGVWDSETQLKFNMNSNVESSISEDGDEIIDVTSIDEAVDAEKVTFIKMDVEGAELKALEGAEKLIKRDKPFMAICIYHKVEDIWELPRKILEFHPNYKLYVRHYSYTDADTILYAVPNND